MSIRHVHTHFLQHGSLELELSMCPENNDPVVKETSDKIICGYLIRDEDCPNPCEDMDGMGHIRSLSTKHINNISVEEAESLLQDDPDVVPLSYFEHGLCLWDVQHGERISRCPDMRWDGMQFAGVWVPDACCRDEINYVGKNKAKRRLRAVELAEQCCKEYTAWANGDCWGVYVDVFDKEGKRIADDSCWGHIGWDWAGEAMEEAMKEQE